MQPKSSNAVAGNDVVGNVTRYLCAEADAVEQILCETLDSESELIREVGEYISFTHGKKLRPLLLLLMHKGLAPDQPAPAEVAAAVELIHVATLLHDDVIDKARQRRGKPSVNARWGDEVAILMADYLYARAFDLALSNLKPEVMRLLCKVTQRMCEGEMLQIKLRTKTYTTEEYVQVVERKTASLFGACTSLGAFLAGRDEADIALAHSFGYDFGISFQITDDALDYCAKNQSWGKDIGMDVSSGKQTLPLLLALAEATDEERRRIEACLKEGDDFQPVFAIIERYNGLEQALDKARYYADQATESLESLNFLDPGSLEHLGSLPAYVIDRAY